MSLLPSCLAVKQASQDLAEGLFTRVQTTQDHSSSRFRATESIRQLFLLEVQLVTALLAGSLL